MNIPAKSYYTEFWALEDVTFDVKRGSSVGILGLNGAGKSTLLQIICGTLSPTSGRISIYGRVAALLELGAGFNTEFTGLENVVLNATILGLTPKEIDERLGDILAFADIGSFIYRPVKTYSSGMYVRLAFSIAIHSDPDILVIDEALAVGDFKFQQKCNLFLKNRLRDTTKLFVSHDIASVASLTTSALVLDKGRLVFWGDTKLAIQEYQKSTRTEETLGNYYIDTPRDQSSQTDIECDDSIVLIENSEGWSSISIKDLSGTLDARISHLKWWVDGQESIQTVRAGDVVTVAIVIEVSSNIKSAIIGYQIQDRFGAVIFGGNSISSGFDTYDFSSIPRIARMSFLWPEICDGKYGITIGIGSGADSECHKVICWAHNIVCVTSVAERPVHGIFNNNITELTLSRY